MDDQELEWKKSRRRYRVSFVVFMAIVVIIIAVAA